MRPQKNLSAIHMHDLEELLKNLKLLSLFQEGKLECKFCKDVIIEDNFGAFFVQDGNIFICCSKLECLANLPKD